MKLRNAKQFGEVGLIIAGQHIEAALYNRNGNGTAYLTGPDDFGPTTPIVSKWTNSPKSFATESDVLVTVKGAGVGKCNLGINAAIGRQLMALRPDPAKLDKRFLFRFLQSCEPQLAKLGQGATVPGITKPAIERFLIPLFPLAEQQRMANTLDKADAIRRKRREAIRYSDNLLHSVFMTTVGPHAPHYESWPLRRVEDLAAKREGSIRTGPFGSDLKHSEFVNDGIAVLGIDNAVQNRFAWGQRRYITAEKYEQLTRYRVFPGDVIITIMGTVGRSAVVPDNIPLAINTKHLACITLNRDQAEPEFLSQSIHRHPEILRQLGLAGRGAIMTGLNLGIIKSLTLPVPPMIVQKRFYERVAAIQNSADQLGIALQEANDLFSSLVQRAFEGGL